MPPSLVLSRVEIRVVYSADTCPPQLFQQLENCTWFGRSIHHNDTTYATSICVFWWWTFAIAPIMLWFWGQMQFQEVTYVSYTGNADRL